MPALERLVNMDHEESLDENRLREIYEDAGLVWPGIERAEREDSASQHSPDVRDMVPR